jgi:hypothetical protein
MDGGIVLVRQNRSYTAGFLLFLFPLGRLSGYTQLSPQEAHGSQRGRERLQRVYGSQRRPRKWHEKHVLFNAGNSNTNVRALGVNQHASFYALRVQGASFGHRGVLETELGHLEPERDCHIPK